MKKKSPAAQFPDTWGNGQKIPCGSGKEFDKCFVLQRGTAWGKMYKWTPCSLHSAAPDLLEAAQDALFVLYELSKEGGDSHIWNGKGDGYEAVKT